MSAVSIAHIKSLTKQIFGQANTLATPLVLIDFTEDHVAALLLGQIIYWSERTDDPDGWFYKTAEEWYADTRLSAYQVRQASQRLERFGVETRVRKVGGTPKMHYRIVPDVFYPLFLQFLESQGSTNLKVKKLNNRKSRNCKVLDSEETARSLKEAETTAETTNRERGTPAAQAPSVPTPKAEAPKKTATRIPHQQLPDAWREYCLKQRPDLDPATVWENFRDYWLAAPGAKGRKADWDATWRMWVRREEGRAGAVRSSQPEPEKHRITMRHTVWMTQQKRDRSPPDPLLDVITRCEQQTYMTGAQYEQLRAAGMER